MARYQVLETYLESRQTDEVPVTFEELEAIIGRKLPASAHVHRAWWSNNPSNNVMTRAWLAAGYRTERVDVAGRKLVFRRAGRSGPPHMERFPPPVDQAATPGSVLETLWAALAGAARIPDGVDLTEPAGAAWEADQP